MWNYQIEENILYEDKEILVCRKTAGMPVQAAKIGTMDMESALKNYLAQKTPGKIPYLGVVHRLVSGGVCQYTGSKKSDPSL